MVKVLFVCTGNICRSPTAEGVFRKRVAQAGLTDHVTIESAGTHGYHIGEPPDPRSQRHAASRGYDLSDQRARRLAPADFQGFDLLLAMDRGHLSQMRAQAPRGAEDRLRLFLDFAGPDRRGRDVPDPYYGGVDGFETVLDLVEDGADGLLTHVRTLLARRG